MKIAIVVAGLAAALIGAPAALAQDASQTASYGEITLRSGFTPDPYRVNLTAGGTIDTSKMLNNCVGKVANAPDLQVYYTAGNLPLYVRTESDIDTTLVVNGPGGEWYCDDDSGGGVNAQVNWSNPRTGVYDIWVGTYGSSTGPASLLITELAYNGGNNGGGGNGGINAGLTASYGEITLRSGFSPDPYRVNLTAGGSIDASTVSTSCVGRVAAAPDLQVYYTAGNLPLYVRTESGIDTTLVVNGPSGEWYCDDDSGGGNNAEVRWNNPASGTYDIWVGTYGNNTGPASLLITELAYNGGGGGGTINPGLTATFGEINLRTGFTPDPYRVNLTAGGQIDASTVSTDCVGKVAAAPDFQITFDAGSLPLFIRTQSGIDTTLVVNGPSGEWYCDDDSGGGNNAEVRWAKPASGTYDIWVGTYGTSTGPASLLITELR